MSHKLVMPDMPDVFTHAKLDVSVVPVGVGDDFPVKPIAGFLVVKAVLDKLLGSRLISREQRERDFERAMQNIKSPMKGAVIAIGKGEDLDPMDRRRKPVESLDGDTTIAIGDTVLFRPIGSYLLDLPGEEFYLIVGDREILGVEKAKQ